MPLPINQTLPLITGDVEVGATLEASTGTWQHQPTGYAYQWLRVNASTVPITGATMHSYTVQAGDVGHGLACTVTATNSTGSASATSATTISVPDSILIVEDGTGKPTANSYASLDFANDYHATRGNTAWGLLSASARKVALINATDYLEQRHLLGWAGMATSDEQALSWPRQRVLKPSQRAYYAENEMPADLLKATAELALRSATAALNPDIETGTITEETIGPITVKYSDGSKTGQTFFPAVSGLLRHLLSGVGGAYQHGLVRV